MSTLKQDLVVFGGVLTGVAIGLVSAAAYVDFKRFEQEEELQMAKSRARFAEEDRDALLSGGRFVRLENPPRYVFRPGQNVVNIAKRQGGAAFRD